jgi:DnaJ domain
VRATRTLYQVLQIDPEAEPDVIEVVYRRLARKYHPDVSSVPDAAERMKEINAAYEILHDPHRRASYDSQLDALEAPPDEQAPEPDLRWTDELEPFAQTEMIGCVRHPGFGSVATCTDCGASLCPYCARLFQPPTCASCLLRWAGRRRFRLALPAMALPGMLAAGYLAWTWLLQGVLGFEPSFWLLLLLAYWTGSIFFGFRGARELAPQSDSIVSGFIGCFLGPFAAPVLIGRSLWEYRQVQRLEAIARTA